MSSINVSPNMNLPVPVTGQELGPDWANDYNNCMGVVDSHNHAAGSGIQINPAGININADLTWNNVNNAINLRSVRLYPQAAPISGGSDLGCLYESGVDLYYNDGNGNQIRITQSGSVAGASGTITGLPSGTASAAYASSSGTFVFQQATSTAANMDVGSIAIRYPGSYPTPSGNFIQLVAPTSLASGYNLQLPALPAQTNVMSLGTTGIISSITYDQVGQGMTSVGANAVANSRVRATGTSVVAGGIAISTSCGNFTTSSTSFVSVTNLSAQIVTTGNPIEISLISDGSGTASQIGANGGSTGIAIATDIEILRDSTVVALYRISAPTNLAITTPSSSVNFIDQVVAGTYTYSVKIKCSNAAGVASVQQSFLVASEL